MSSEVNNRQVEAVRAAIGLTGQFAAVDSGLSREKDIMLQVYTRYAVLGRAVGQPRRKHLFARRSA